MRTIVRLRYAFWILFHPFDGFWCLKQEKRGDVKSALILLAAAIMTYTASRQLTGFLFNPLYNQKLEINLVADISMVLALFLLWCTANWCLTSLMDGKGSFKDIVIFTAYSLTPYILTGIAVILFSYVFNLEEGAFYYAFRTFGYIWSGALLILGTLVTHQYELGKTILTVLLVLIGMLIISFVILLGFNVMQQFLSFVQILYREMTLRT